jgi:hypothetical protein
MAARKKTVGVSPKAPAAAVGAVLAPIVAGLLLDWLGVEVNGESLEVALTALVSALGALGGAVAAPPGAVVTARPGRIVHGDDGYGLVGLVIAIVLVALLAYLVYLLVAAIISPFWGTVAALIVVICALLSAVQGRV